jgi:hypothetical protein
MKGKLYVGRADKAYLATPPNRPGGNLVANPLFWNTSGYSETIVKNIICDVWEILVTDGNLNDVSITYRNPGITIRNNTAGEIYFLTPLKRVPPATTRLSATAYISSSGSGNMMYTEYYDSSYTSHTISSVEIGNSVVGRKINAVDNALEGADQIQVNVAFYIASGSYLAIDWCRVDEGTNIPGDFEYVSINATRLEVSYYRQHIHPWKILLGSVNGTSASFTISNNPMRVYGPSVIRHISPTYPDSNFYVMLADGSRTITGIDVSKLGCISSGGITQLTVTDVIPSVLSSYDYGAMFMSSGDGFTFDARL